MYDWLRDEKNRKWLLILDNIDDTFFLPWAGSNSQGAQKNSSDSKDLLAYLPQSQNGGVLVTTRSKGIALEIAEESDIIVVEPMDKSHALALFKKKLRVLEDSNDIAELAAALEFMPLAIVQAAAYISQRAPRCSVRRYLNDFQKSDRKKTSLLDYKGGHLRRDREAQNSIIITWYISFEHIRQTSPSAANLLSLMSFFDRQGIPEALVRNQAETGNDHRSREEPYKEDEKEDDEDSASNPDKDDRFEDDVDILRNYSFISIETDRTFEMHALVQLATRKWLEDSKELEKWKQQYIKSLSAEFPPGVYKELDKVPSSFSTREIRTYTTAKFRRAIKRMGFTTT